MKKMFLPLLIICLVGSTIVAQNKSRMNKEMRPLQRIEQWEKIKLIETLNLDEETAIRFFTRRHDNQMAVKEILDQRDLVVNELENGIKNGSTTNDAVYKDQISKLIVLESSITSEREKFLKSLNDLLTPLQIAKLIVFESKFRREVRETLMRRGKDPANN